MRLILLISLGVIFYSSCLIVECTSNGNTNHTSVHRSPTRFVKKSSYRAALLQKSKSKLRWKPQSIGVKNRNPTNITDLNVDVLLTIFDHLNTKEILNLAKAELDPTIFAAVKHTFWSRFKDYTVYVAPYAEEMIFGKKAIYISNRKGMKSLKIIGSGIRHLVMSSTTASVNECINKNVGDSLITLELKNLNEDTFVNFENAFENLEELIFDYSQYYRLQTDQPPLNQLFPNVQKITLKSEQKINSNIDFSSFQHLNSLDVNNTCFTDKQIEVILSENPQIQNLKVFKLSQNLADAINWHLFNLENLTVSTFDFERITRFEHLKHLVVSSSKPGTVYRVSCPQLSSLEMRFAPNMALTQSWTQFLVKLPTLSHLTILGTNNSVDVNPRLVLLTMFSGSLVEISIDGTGVITIDTFVKIFRNNRHLKRLAILGANNTIAVDRIFRKKFGNRWNIIETEDLILEKKR